MKALADSAKKWIVDRFALQPLIDGVLNRKVPKTAWYFGDGAALFTLLAVQIVTGAVMALTYTPSVDSAYASINYLTDAAPMGWLVRRLHYWASGGMFVLVFFHMFRVMLTGSYKAPREGTWMIGVLLLFAVFIMGFTGYLLRWDERAVYATLLVLHMFQKVPLIGDWLVMFVQGGSELGALTLTRLYAVHVVWVPAVMLALVGFHLYLVIAQGVRAPSEAKQPVYSAEEQRRLYETDSQKGEYFYPDTVAKSGLFSLVVLCAVVIAVFAGGNPPLYPEANLIEPTMPQGEWWYWWYSGLIATVPEVVAPALVVIFPPLLFVVLMALPFLDRNPYRNIRRRPLIFVSIGLSVVLLLFLTFQRARSPWTGWPIDELPPVPGNIELSPSAVRGRSLFNRYGCNSCHAIAGSGTEVGPDLTDVGRDHSRQQITNNIVNPPADSPMPNDYGERLSTQELSDLVDFLYDIGQR